MTSLDPSTILSSSVLVGLATLSVYAGSVGSYTVRPVIFSSRVRSAEHVSLFV
jgi:hypothetical protein